MNFCGRRFNLYLLLTAALAFVCGCAMLKGEHKQTAALRIHIESVASVPGAGQTISVMRSQPVLLNIANEPFLTEADVASAQLLEVPDGFAVEIKFDNAGGWALEQYSAVNLGKHLAIFGQWGDKPADGRWLAAPIIVHRMANATLVFTPDASRAEMEQFVKGLNADAKENAAAKAKQ
jgi:hypothetical protein